MQDGLRLKIVPMKDGDLRLELDLIINVMRKDEPHRFLHVLVELESSRSRPTFLLHVEQGVQGISRGLQ